MEEISRFIEDFSMLGLGELMNRDRSLGLVCRVGRCRVRVKCYTAETIWSVCYSFFITCACSNDYYRINNYYRAECVLRHYLFTQVEDTFISIEIKCKRLASTLPEIAPFEYKLIVTIPE